LVHGFQNSSNRKIIFQLDGDLLVRECFENREDELEEDSDGVSRLVRCRSTMEVRV